MKILSIIIPHYNSRISLFRLLDSIEWNKLTEVIVVDDNSSSSEFNLIELQKKYPEAKFLINHKGKGAGGARNCGIEKSTGKFLMFADSDDFLLKNYFKTFKDSMREEIEIYYFYPTSYNEVTKKLGTRHLDYLERLLEFEKNCKKQ